MSKWRPISTAPKDETAVLGWLSSHGVVVMLYTGESPKRLYRWGWSVTEGSALWPSLANQYLEPTHWMPLPEPPKDD